jgi:nucleoside phosphorylase
VQDRALPWAATHPFAQITTIAMARYRPPVQDFTIGWISALPFETHAAVEMLDERYESNDYLNDFIFGRSGRHNVVIGSLIMGEHGLISAAVLAEEMLSKFPAIQLLLMVGVGSAVPSSADIRLGDVVIGSAHGDFDLGKVAKGEYQSQAWLCRTPLALFQTAVAKLQQLPSLNPKFRRPDAGTDILYRSEYVHVGGSTCKDCSEEMTVIREPREHERVVLHYGKIASNNVMIKDGMYRDKVSTELGGILCFEIEAVGLTSNLPYLIIKGVCDYADSHRNSDWQVYAAITAAACAKKILALISTISHSDVRTMQRIFTVPLERNEKFVGREDILVEIAKKRKQAALRNHFRLALVGLGGIGSVDDLACDNRKLTFSLAKPRLPLNMPIEY